MRVPLPMAWGLLSNSTPPAASSFSPRASRSSLATARGGGARVGLAPDPHPAGGLELLGKGVEVLDGEGDVAVAGAELVGLLLVVVKGGLQPGLGGGGGRQGGGGRG